MGSRATGSLSSPAGGTWPRGMGRPCQQHFRQVQSPFCIPQAVQAVHLMKVCMQPFSSLHLQDPRVRRQAKEPTGIHAKGEKPATQSEKRMLKSTQTQRSSKPLPSTSCTLCALEHASWGLLASKIRGLTADIVEMETRQSCSMAAAPSKTRRTSSTMDSRSPNVPVEAEGLGLGLLTALLTATAVLCTLTRRKYGICLYASSPTNIPSSTMGSCGWWVRTVLTRVGY
mmetsp:Transcript_55571/g.98966  ORF Transcript_55571/g.98966 Transcript_55571/m.98966 type:complete len:228 (+) Transcript_55571:551-1234(+)